MYVGIMPMLCVEKEPCRDRRPFTTGGGPGGALPCEKTAAGIVNDELPLSMGTCKLCSCCTWSMAASGPWKDPLRLFRPEGGSDAYGALLMAGKSCGGTETCTYGAGSGPGDAPRGVSIGPAVVHAGGAIGAGLGARMPCMCFGRGGNPPLAALGRLCSMLGSSRSYVCPTL